VFKSCFHLSSYDEARKKLKKSVKGDDLCTTDADEREKPENRDVRKSREDLNEEDDMAINRSKKTSLKRIRQYPASGSEEEMANSPVPPKPPAILIKMFFTVILYRSNSSFPPFPPISSCKLRVFCS
jgi:hypothetical protein